MPKGLKGFQKGHGRLYNEGVRKKISDRLIVAYKNGKDKNNIRQLGLKNKGRVSPRKGKTYKDIYGDKWKQESVKRGLAIKKSWDLKGRVQYRRPRHAGTDYELWRKSIFQRDDFTCQKYGIKGGKLVAHHINNFSQFPELRLAIDNGITLSEKAHKEFHKKYGKKNNTKGQIKEFLN